MVLARASYLTMGTLQMVIIFTQKHMITIAQYKTVG